MRRVLHGLVAMALAGAAVTATAWPATANTAGPVTTASAVPSALSATSHNAQDGLIAFVRSEQIYTISASGTGLKKLTSSAKNDQPQWSPDGQRIAYIHETATGARQIWVMKADGTAQKQVTTMRYATAPAWSPDGKWLLFGASSVVGDQYAALEKVKSTAPFGTPAKVMALDPDGNGLQTNPQIDSWVTWSPSGQVIFYSHNFPDSPDNYILDLDLASGQLSEIDNVGGSCCGLGYFSDVTIDRAGQEIAYADWSFDEDSLPPVLPVVTMWALPGSSPGSGWSSAGTVRGDQAPAFAPAGDHVVLLNTSTGQNKLFVTDQSLQHRRYLTSGYMPDWQPLP